MSKLVNIIAQYDGLFLMIALLIAVVITALVRTGLQKSEKVETRLEPEAIQKKPEEIPNRQELVAAVCSAVAEEMGADISSIRVLSFKKL